MRVWKHILRFFAAALFVVALPGSGCVITIDPGGGGGGDDGGSSQFSTTVTVSSGGTGPDTILIRVINNTNATLDPEIYITGQAVTDPAQLFTDANKFTAYGVGTRGLLGDFDRDSFTFECGNVRVLGTTGGLFGDDLDNPDGTGRQRILTIDAGFTCGDTITFTYSR